MGRVVDVITPELVGWIAAQPMFFVASAPLDGDGHVNLSPKGHDTVRVLGPREVAYLDLTGSGVETIAHVRENGRVTVMWCAFSGPPRIVRVHGQGRVHVVGDPRYDDLIGAFGDFAGIRAVITVAATRISTSCGYGVPRMTVVEDRDDMSRWAARKGPDGVEAYWADKNARSIDDLPGLPSLAP